MTKNDYIGEIERQMANLETYKPEYTTIIEALASILERRDIVYDEFLNEGGHSVIDGKKNQRLVMWDDLNKTALAYWKELGISPSAMKKITGDGKLKRKNGLAEAIAKFQA